MDDSRSSVFAVEGKAAADLGEIPGTGGAKAMALNGSGYRRSIKIHLVSITLGLACIVIGIAPICTHALGFVWYGP